MILIDVCISCSPMESSFVDVILYFFRSMFQLLWFSRRTINNNLNIFIKSNTGTTLSVELDPKWDIKNVKEVIAPQLGLPPEEVKIILAGKELDDSLVIEVKKRFRLFCPTLLLKYFSFRTCKL